MDGLFGGAQTWLASEALRGIFCFLIYRFLGPFPGMSELGRSGAGPRIYCYCPFVFTGLHRLADDEACVQNPWSGETAVTEMEHGQSSGPSPWATIISPTGCSMAQSNQPFWFDRLYEKLNQCLLTVSEVRTKGVWKNRITPHPQYSETAN